MCIRDRKRCAGSGTGNVPRTPLFPILVGGATARPDPPKSASGERQRCFFGGPGGRQPPW
eukprot:1989106-Alexandrium_andersonii.AAC.1